MIKELKKYLYSLLAIAILSACLLGCGKNEEDSNIMGKVINVFGDPLGGVHVSIENSEFTSITGQDGMYSLDYVPGTIKIVYTKEGFESSHNK